MNRHDTLLIACGTPESRKNLRATLGENYNLLEAGNPQQTLILLEQNHSCIASIVLDITNDDNLKDGILLQEKAASLISRIPVIVIARDNDVSVLDHYFTLGAADVIPMDYDPYAMLRRIDNIVQLHLHRENLEELVHEQAKSLRHSNDVMVDALSSIIEYRSVESGQHILRIRRFTRILLEQVAASCPEYGLTEEIISIVSSAAALHDVGKIGIADSILTKPGKLTPEEREIMKTHTLIGCQILERLANMGNEEYLRYAHNICHYHHERWDGHGYPEGLSGDAIPICAQVVGLADVYDALTTDRVYKAAYNCQTAVNMILSGECGTFSSKLLECFKLVIPRFEEVCHAYADGLSPKTETFDVSLPEPTQEKPGALNIINGKYQCLLHYINALVLELSVDQGYFHLRYSPYPELAFISQANSFAELEQLVLEQVVMPEDRQRMYDLIHQGIHGFLHAGMRRQVFQFHFRGRDGGAQLYDVTLLRADVTQQENRSLAVLCRKLGSEAAPVVQTEFSSRFDDMLESTYCCRNDQDFTLLRLGNGITTLAGYSSQDLATRFGNRLIELVHPEDREPLHKAFREQLNRGSSVQTEFRVLFRDGHEGWVMNWSRLVTDANGQEVLYCYLLDISETKQASSKLQRRLERYEIILTQTENVLFDWNLDTDTIEFSDTWEKLFGFAPISRNIWNTLSHGSFFHPDELPLLYDRIHALQNGSDYEMLEVRIATAQGRYIWCRFRASAIRDDAGNLKRIVGAIININTEKQAEQALQERADRDALTKLLNKDAGRKQAEEYLSKFPQGTNCALLIIDLDNFKQINDQYGHLFGDTVLTRAAKEIQKLFRNQDIVARIGGDEFMVLLRGVSDRELACNRCERLLNVFRNAFYHGQSRISIGCSIGIALSPEHGTNYVELFQRADQALYQAKAQGKHNYVVYDSNTPNQYSRDKTATAISKHIDSDDQPGLANSSLVQYAFRTLYASQDVEASIGQILALIGQQTNVSRVYVFENSPDNRFCSNTYEWCNVGIAPEIENLQNVSYETDIPDYEKNFDENGIFYCPDITTLPQNIYDILAPQGIKSILHCAIRDKGVFRGYIGFDDCTTQRFWTKEQINLLSYFSEMLSVFLMKMQAQARTRRYADDLLSILDNQNAWIYVVDSRDLRIKYLNSKAKQITPQATIGIPCHLALRGKQVMCRNCPMGLPEKTGCTTMEHPTQPGAQIQVESTRIRWDGEDAFLITCRQV